MTEIGLPAHSEKSLLHLVNQPLPFSTTDFGTQFKPENFKSFPLEKGEKRALCNPFTGAIYLRPGQYDKWQECPTIEIAIKGMTSVVDANPKTADQYVGLLDLLYYSRDLQRFTLEKAQKELNVFTDDPMEYLKGLRRSEVNNEVFKLKDIFIKLLDSAVIKTNPYRRAGLLSRAILFGVGEEDYQKRLIEKLTNNKELFEIIDNNQGIDFKLHEDFNNFYTDELKNALSIRLEASQTLITTALDDGAKDFIERKESIPDMAPES